MNESSNAQVSAERFDSAMQALQILPGLLDALDGETRTAIEDAVGKMVDAYHSRNCVCVPKGAFANRC